MQRLLWLLVPEALLSHQKRGSVLVLLFALVFPLVFALVLALVFDRMVQRGPVFVLSHPESMSDNVCQMQMQRLLWRCP